MAMTRQQVQEEGKEMDPILKALSLPPLPPLSSRSKVPCFRSASIGVSSNLRRLSYTGSLASQSSDNLTAWRELRLGEILCQREREEELLQQAFQRIQQAQHFDTRKDSGAGDLMPPSQIVLVRGAEAGLGQTTLVSRLRQQVQSQKGVVLSISCERGGNPNPHANVVRALRQWAQDASEGVDNPGGVWHQLGKSLTVEESAFLSRVVPEIQTLLGRMTCTTTPSYSSKQRVSLFKVAFCKLVYELAARRPCVVLVQDLHESDEVTLDLWRALVRAEDMRDYERPFLFVGTYRPTLRPLESLSEQFQRAHKTQVTHISLEPFGPDETKQRLLKLIDVGTHAVLQELVARSRGIPFYLMQLLEGLIVAGELEYDTHARVWRLSGGRIEFPTTSQLIGLDELPAETLLFLRIFSSLGTRTSRFLLERSRSSDSLDHDLELATGSGILVKREEGAYAFAHEAIREMVYESISVDQRLLFHKQIAENLWLSFDLDELDHYLLILVNQLVACRDTLSSQATRAAVAHLCLRAGERSAEVSAYHTSYHYLTVGMELLGINGWENSYDVCLALNSAACEVAYCVSKYEDIHRFADDTIAEAKSFTDSLRVQITKIYAIGTNEDPSKSLEYGNILLERLGEAVGTAPKQQQADAAIRRILRRLQGCTDGHILRLSSMEDADKLAAMQILNCYVPYVFAVDHHLAPIVVERMIALTLDYGISALSGVGFAYLGTVLCWMGDVRNGQRFGELALGLTNRFNIDAWMGRVATFYYGTIFCWKQPFKEAIAPLKDARMVALACGDIEFAMLNANLLCLLELDLVPIPELLDSIREYQDTMLSYGQTFSLQFLHPSLYTLLCCSGETNTEFAAVHETFHGSGDSHFVTDSDSIFGRWINYGRLVVSYLFGSFDEAARYAQGCASLMERPTGCADASMPCLIDCLLAVQRLRKNRSNLALLIRIRRRIRQLRRWTKEAPSNFLGKLNLVEAELASTCGRSRLAHSKYVSAISLCKESGFYMQTALANELAGKHFLRREDDRSARRYLKEALRIYRAWGGHAKADHLVAEVKLS